MSDVAIGIDVGGTKALALMVARDGRVLAELQSQTPHDVGMGAGDATAKVLVEQVIELCDRQGLNPSHVPVGLGLPGMMRRERAFGVCAELANGHRRATWASNSRSRCRIRVSTARTTPTARRSPNTNGAREEASVTSSW